MTHAPKPAAVLFDLDGTLVDTAPDFIYSLNLQRSLHGLPALPDPAIRAQVSNGGRALIELGFALTPEMPQFSQRLQELLALYEANIVRGSRLFDGLEAVLLQLEQAGIPWGVVTNKPRRFTAPLLAGLDLQRRCGVVVCPDDVQQRKPDPESLLLACQRLAVEPRHSIYVGDHLRDIEAGRRAGMLTLAACYGYLSDPAEAEAWQADHLLASGQALHDWLADRLK